MKEKIMSKQFMDIKIDSFLYYDKHLLLNIPFIFLDFLKLHCVLIGTLPSIILRTKGTYSGSFKNFRTGFLFKNLMYDKMSPFFLSSKKYFFFSVESLDLYKMHGLCSLIMNILNITWDLKTFLIKDLINDMTNDNLILYLDVFNVQNYLSQHIQLPFENNEWLNPFDIILYWNSKELSNLEIKNLKLKTEYRWESLTNIYIDYVFFNNVYISCEIFIEGVEDKNINLNILNVADSENALFVNEEKGLLWDKNTQTYKRYFENRKYESVFWL